jgi:hypothetical protein
MSRLREQLELIKQGFEDGQIGLQDYLRAMRGQMDAMEDVVGSVPLMAETMGADADVVARLRVAADGMLAELRRLLEEGTGP